MDEHGHFRGEPDVAWQNDLHLANELKVRANDASGDGSDTATAGLDAFERASPPGPTATTMYEYDVPGSS